MSAPWRAVVAIEGQATTDGRIIEPGALTLPTAPVALILIAADGWAVIGFADRIERDGHRIIASGIMHGDVAAPTGNAGIALRKPEAKRVAGVLSIRKAEVAAIYAGGDPLWQGCVFG